MSSWWDDLWNQLFVQDPGYGDVSIPILGSYLGPGGMTRKLLGEPIDTSWIPRAAVGQGPLPVSPVGSSASPSPSPSAKASGTTSGAQPSPSASPKAGSNQAVQAITDAIQSVRGSGSQLYGSIPLANVYMGRNKKPGGVATGAVAGAGGGTVPLWQTLQEVIASVNDWGPKEISRFNRLAGAAFPNWKPTNNLDQISQIWTAVTTRTAMMNERGHLITPWSLLARYGTADQKKPGGTPKTITSTSVNLTDTPSARSAYSDALKAVLGRAATDKEKKDFAAALSAAEKKNPSTTTTTTNAAGTAVSSTTHQGLNPNTFAQDWALSHNKDEATAFQMAGQMAPWLFEGISAPV